MSYIEYQEKLERVQDLAEKNATGTPKELANRINVSQRTVYRIIQTMKDKGIPIEYCRKINTYYINN
jgi:predicted DNA-binding transcriptional regulator YafY